MKNLTPAKVTVLMFVVIGGLVAAYIAKGLFAVEEAPRRPSTRNLPMAIAELKPGTVVTEDHLGLGPFPNREIKSDMLLSNRVIVGRVVKETIQPARPIRAPQLYQPGERPPLQVAKGMRAVSVSVAASVDIVDGLIKPGDFVDVHFTVTDLTNDRLRELGGVTLTLFKGVRVIAINRNYQQGNVDLVGNTVTLELAPEQIDIMILAQKKGAITLTYNPEGNPQGVVTVPDENRATLHEILGLDEIPDPEPPFRAKIYRERALQTLDFDKDGNQTDSSSNGIPPPTPTSTPQPSTQNSVVPPAPQPARPSPANDQPTADDEKTKNVKSPTA